MLYPTMIAFTLTLLLFIIKNRKAIYDFFDDDIRLWYYGKKYKNYAHTYHYARIKEFYMAGVLVKRNWKAKIYVPIKDLYVEGTVIGLDADGMIYIKCQDNNIIVYALDAVRRHHIIDIIPACS